MNRFILPLSLFFVSLVTTTAFSAELKVATYNLGYLQVTAGFGMITLAEVPDYQQRLSYLEPELLEYLAVEQPEILAFQEIWNDENLR